MCGCCGLAPATTFLTLPLDGQEREVPVCKDCARELASGFAENSSDFDPAFDAQISDAPFEALMDACFFTDTFEDADAFGEDDPFEDDAFIEDEALEPHTHNLFHSLRAAEGEADRVCAGCGATWPQIARDERAGCSRCYATFRASLTRLLEQVQRAPQHDGKQPRAAQKRRLRLEHLRQRRDHQLALLQGRLAEAVKSERYEEAATLRDRIKIVSSSLF